MAFTRTAEWSEDVSNIEPDLFTTPVCLCSHSITFPYKYNGLRAAQLIFRLISFAEMGRAQIRN